MKKGSVQLLTGDAFLKQDALFIFLMPSPLCWLNEERGRGFERNPSWAPCGFLVNLSLLPERWARVGVPGTAPGMRSLCRQLWGSQLGGMDAAAFCVLYPGSGLY